MKKILLSINPEHVSKILSGEKAFEYRTKVAKQDVKSLLIYETSPVKRVVAEAEILEVLELPPEDLWSTTKDYSGITKDFFDAYFANREIAYAYRLGNIKAYDRPMELSYFGVKAAPQSFVYVTY